MKTKSKFRRAILRSEIEKKYANHGLPVVFKTQSLDKALKEDIARVEK